LNPEHYEKIQRVAQRSRQAMGPLYAEFQALPEQPGEGGKAALGATLSMPGTCQKFWDEEFPKEQGYGVTVPLDLEGADLTAAIFAGMLLDGQLDRANFRNARPIARYGVSGKSPAPISAMPAFVKPLSSVRDSRAAGFTALTSANPRSWPCDPPKQEKNPISAKQTCLTPPSSCSTMPLR
jgi:hypothetical protein